MIKKYSRAGVQEMIAKGDVQGLIQALQYGDEFSASDAAEALVGLGGDQAVDPLTHMLNDKHRPKLTRVTAADALGKIGNRRAVPDLIHALNDPDVQLTAIHALEKIRDERAIQPLIQIFQTNINLTVRHSMQDVLGTFGLPALEPLVQLLKHQNPDVRQGAVRALGKIADPRAVEPLIQTLKDSDSDVRWSVTLSLGEIQDVRAKEPLLQIIKDESEDSAIREGAKEALEKLLEGIGEKIDLNQIVILPQIQEKYGREEEEQVLRKYLIEESKDPTGWEALGLHCPECNSLEMRFKPCYFGTLYTEDSDTIVRCFNCGSTTAYKKKKALMHWTVESSESTTMPSTVATGQTAISAAPSWVKPFAIASLVLSITALPASICGCGFLFPPLAVILGLIAYVQTKKSNGPRSIRGMALAGTILGGLLIIFLVILFIGSLIWPNGLDLVGQ